MNVRSNDIGVGKVFGVIIGGFFGGGIGGGIGIAVGFLAFPHNSVWAILVALSIGTPILLVSMACGGVLGSVLDRMIK